MGCTEDGGYHKGSLAMSCSGKCGCRVMGVPMRTLALGLVLGGSLALLIWAKLRLVTTVPRTAYAVPEQVDARPATAKP